MPLDSKLSPPPAEQEIVESSALPRAEEMEPPTQKLAEKDDPAGVASLMNKMSLDQPLTVAEKEKLPSMISDQLQHLEMVKNEYLSDIEKLKEQKTSQLDRFRRRNPDNGVQEFFDFGKDLELVDAERVINGLKNTHPHFDLDEPSFVRKVHQVLSKMGA